MLAIKSAKDGGRAWEVATLLAGSVVITRQLSMRATRAMTTVATTVAAARSATTLAGHAESKLKSSRNAKTFPHLTPAQAASVSNKNRDRANQGGGVLKAVA